MFGLMVRFEVKVGCELEFDELIEQTVAGVRDKELGTVFYVCQRVEGSSSSRIFYELYRDREAFEEHERQEHVRAFFAGRDRYVADTRVESLSPWAAKGVTLADYA